MSSAKESLPADKEGLPERGARIYRNFNTIGAVVLGGLALVVPVGGAVLGGLAGLNAVQAGAGELVRRSAKKSRLKKG